MISQAVFALSTLGGATLSLLRLTNISIPVTTLVLVAVVIAVIAATVSLILMLRATRFAKLRVALTGGPGVGKTVLANLLFDRLMTLTDRSVSFTADSATAISVYQTIRGIDEDEWPANTLDTVVNKYLGKLRFRNPPRELVVDLEIGDSAGEHWINLAKSARGPRPAQTSSYLEYVISAHAVIHVIASDSLLAPDLTGQLRHDMQDLLVASQLMKATRGSREEFGMLLVVSKADLLIKSDISGPMKAFLRESQSTTRIFRPSELGTKTYVDFVDPEDIHLVMAIDEICQMATRLAETFPGVGIMFTSIFEGGTRKLLERHNATDLLSWIREMGQRSWHASKGSKIWGDRN